MKIKPILFQADMVRALLDGRKTMTRRIVKPRPEYAQTLRNGQHETSIDGGFDCDVKYIESPYGKPGDLLWARETWGKESVSKQFRDENWQHQHINFVYKADYIESSNIIEPVKWKPSIHMFKKHSRFTLKITDVRVERVQDIKNFDAKAEGIEYPSPHRCKGTGIHDCYICQFKNLWNSINAKNDNGWEKNPYVWVISFEVIKQNVLEYIMEADKCGSLQPLLNA